MHPKLWFSLLMVFGLLFQLACAKPNKSAIIVQSGGENAHAFPEKVAITVSDGSQKIRSRISDFKVKLPDNATKMRWHQSNLLIYSEDFRVAKSDFQYIFPVLEDSGNGLVTIYLQFTDASGAESPIYQQSFRIEIFVPDPNAFTIGDGSGFSISKLTDVFINVPSNAYEMRIFEYEPVMRTLGGIGVSVSGLSDTDAEFPATEVGVYPAAGSDGSGGLVNILSDGASTSPTDNASKTWIMVEPIYQHTFKDVGLKQLYLQFRDSDGSVSLLYRRVVTIEPLEQMDMGFRINDGAEYATSREIFLNLMPPPGATAFRFSEQEPLTPKEYRWIGITGQAVPVVLSKIGSTNIYVQYRNVYGDVSDNYVENIVVDPFFDDPGAVFINRGEKKTSSPNVEVSFMIPRRARAMVVSHNLMTLELLPFSEIKPFIRLELPAIVGPHTVYARFRNEIGDLSQVFSGQIQLNLP